MTCFDDNHDQFIVPDFVDDPVLTLAYPISIMAGELLATGRPRFISQALDSPDNALPVSLEGDGFQLFLSRGFDQEPISCHCASVP